MQSVLFFRNSKHCGVRKQSHAERTRIMTKKRRIHCNSHRFRLPVGSNVTFGLARIAIAIVRRQCILMQVRGVNFDGLYAIDISPCQVTQHNENRPALVPKASL
jgi:hypothetical protein